jgi:hypothetical protein
MSLLHPTKQKFSLIPQAGLGNKLRVLLAFLCIHGNIDVYWPWEPQCPGTFLDIFENIEGVNFVHSEGSKFNYRGCDSFEDIMEKYSSLDNCKVHELQKISFQTLKLRQEIDEKVKHFVDENNIRNAIAVHIRRTDHVGLAQRNDSYTPDNEFYKYIDSFDNNIPIFLATDNKQTQDQFRNRYTYRVVFYSPILDNLTSCRFTTLEHSIIDMFISREAKYFMGSGYSSFSDMIEFLRL